MEYREKIIEMVEKIEDSSFLNFLYGILIGYIKKVKGGI